MHKYKITHKHLKHVNKSITYNTIHFSKLFGFLKNKPSYVKEFCCLYMTLQFNVFIQDKSEVLIYLKELEEYKTYSVFLLFFFFYCTSKTVYNNHKKYVLNIFVSKLYKRRYFIGEKK